MGEGEAQASPPVRPKLEGPDISLSPKERIFLYVIADGYPVRFPITAQMAKWFPEQYADLLRDTPFRPPHIPFPYFFHDEQLKNCNGFMDLRKISAWQIVVELDRGSDLHEQHSRAFVKFVELMEREMRKGEEWRDHGSTTETTT